MTTDLGSDGWPLVHPDAAGLDIGASEIWVCVPADRATPAVRSFVTFTPDLQGTILVRRSFAEYPPANGRPAFRHDDLTIVYRDADSKQFRATYWDNEGHVIRYSVQTAEGGVVFVSEGPPSGQRFRISYSREGTSQVKIKFEIAAPGKDFAPYVEASARKR